VGAQVDVAPASDIHFPTDVVSVVHASPRVAEALDLFETGLKRFRTNLNASAQRPDSLVSLRLKKYQANYGTIEIIRHK
jgi:hypothetical protein